jgi:hypothetical protein
MTVRLFANRTQSSGWIAAEQAKVRQHLLAVE